MQMRPFECGAAGFVLMVVSLQTLVAQAVPNDPAAGNWASPLGTPTSILPPYSVFRKTTRVQTLADGTIVTQESVVKEARDSHGRSYRETRVPSLADPEDTRNEIVVHVIDPVARTRTTWNTLTRDATIFHDPGPVRLLPPPPGGWFGGVTGFVGPLGATTQSQAKVEKLGSRLIDGVNANGIRITRIVPPGAEGNDQAMTVTSEQWFSPELGLAVLWIDDHPRLGVTTMQLVDLDRSQPDPALFQVPAGYRIKHRCPRWRD
jgi:hypothetical protein